MLIILRDIIPQGGIMKKAFLLATAAVILILACSKEEEPVEAKFWPFAQGNTWTTKESYSYDVENTPYVGSGNSTTSYEVGAFTEREDGKLVWPVTSRVETDSIMTSINYYHITEDSVYVYTLKDDETPKAVEPNSLAVGDKWDGNLVLPFTIPELTGFPTDLAANFEVIGTETITVEAGTFNCVVVEIDLPDYSVDSAATQWRAEDVGMVKMTTDFETKFSIFDVSVQGASEMTSYDFQ
jgi:hypothetical protein